MNKKIIAPCVIAVVMCLYFAAMAVGLFVGTDIISGICALLFIGAIAVMISVTKERIQEIRSGEEDDLSEY